jgi:hypothetical protein
MKTQRGCGKEGEMAFRFTSPALNKEGPFILRECPLGYVLRAAPYLFDAISAQSLLESGAFDLLRSPMWLQRICRVIGSEKARLFDAKQKDQQTKRDAKIAQGVLSRG